MRLVLASCLATASAWVAPRGAAPRGVGLRSTPTYQVIDIPSDKPKVEEAPPKPTPEEEEARLVVPIEGRPIVGVSGFFGDPTCVLRVTPPRFELVFIRTRGPS